MGRREAGTREKVAASRGTVHARCVARVYKAGGVAKCFRWNTAYGARENTVRDVRRGSRRAAACDGKACRAKSRLVARPNNGYGAEIR